MAARAAIVEGDRNVLITAPTNNALIVTGDGNTVEMKLDGAGAALAFAFRWNRPKARRRALTARRRHRAWSCTSTATARSACSRPPAIRRAWRTSTARPASARRTSSSRR